MRSESTTYFYGENSYMVNMLEFFEFCKDRPKGERAESRLAYNEYIAKKRRFVGGFRMWYHLDLIQKFHAQREVNTQ
jgi:hypothetical protein